MPSADGALFSRDELGTVDGEKEAGAEEFGERGQILHGCAVEAASGIEKAVGVKAVEVGMEDEVVAKGGKGGGEAARTSSFNPCVRCRHYF